MTNTMDSNNEDGEIEVLPPTGTYRAAGTQVVVYTPLEEFLKDLDRYSAEQIHARIRGIWNTVAVPIGLPRIPGHHPTMNLSPEDTHKALLAMIEHILTRPERTTLCDIEMNWMQNQLRAVFSPDKLQTAKQPLRDHQPS